jgi:solute:Na+ symporter, SSS family
MFIVSMTILGLHWLDILVLLAYIAAVLAIGQYLSKRVKTENDFFLGGRSMGKWYQFFLNFGNMADPSAAPAASGSVYKQGIGGIWLFLIPLFMTPYYWFMTVWFRRVRLTTIADLFEERLESRSLATLYALVAILVSVLTIGFGNIVALKTLQPIMIKSPSHFTEADRKMLDGYKEYESLRELHTGQGLSGEQAQRYDVLKDLHHLGTLKPYVSYLSPLSFYFFTTLLLAVFIMTGGLTATAMIDAVQAVLIVVISFILIPFGLAQIGGFQGLHEKVPEAMFAIFGSEHHSEYTWYSIAALLLMSFVGINAASGNMNVAGSAKDELAARIGAVSGGFGKRFVTIAWGYTGLIALALWGPDQADPEQTWGRLTLMLLPAGLIGLMIVGILGGKLASLGAQAVINSALVVKNLYEPLFPGKSDRHYMVVARISIPVILGLGILVALWLGNAISLLKLIVSIAVVWGAPIYLIFHWRRLTGKAVWVQVIATLLFIGIIPLVVSAVPDLRRHPALVETTRERVVTVESLSTHEDVRLGRAAEVGVKITREHRIEPVPLYFEDGLTRLEPSNPDSPKEGIGRFNIEIYLVRLLGVDVSHFTPPMILTARFLVDALLPILILLLVSWVTRPGDPQKLARFYARLKTPVGATPEVDAEAVALSIEKPDRFDHTKLFPGSNWEFTKWDRTDVVGFLACCAVTGLILLIFKGILLIGT